MKKDKKKEHKLIYYIIVLSFTVAVLSCIVMAFCMYFFRTVKCGNTAPLSFLYLH